MTSNDDPISHYDRITRAWQYLLGEDFHYGYFQSHDETLDAATDSLTTLMAKKARLTPGIAVLDVGCGIGNPACMLAQRYGCRVTGITTSPNGVDAARLRARERGCSDLVTFSIADGMQNGFPDESFDRVWVLESSHLMPLKDRLLMECSRVLRTHGILVLCDVILPGELPFSEVLGRSKDFMHLHYAFGRAKMETLDTYRRLAENAGLRVSELLDISEQTFPTFAHWSQRVEGNSHEVRSLIGDEGLWHFRASCEVLPRLWRERVIGYGLMVAEKP